MNSKRKLLISMLAIVFVLLAVVATVAIAFALTQQTITTSVNIGYTVEDIDGSASATYTIGGVTNYLEPIADAEHVSQDNRSLLFKAGDSQNAGNLMFPEGQIPLSAQNDNIVIQYTYSNTGPKHYIASMTFDATLIADNMKVEYSIDGTTYSEQRYAVVVPAHTSNRSYWIKISIENKAKNASFVGDFNWLLSACDPQAESYLSLTSLEFQGSNGSYSASVSTSGAYAGQLVYPSAVNGDPVTTIAQNTSLTQEQKNQITSVYIPDSVTTINDNALEGFTNLQTVNFEQNETGSASVQSATGLTTIGQYAFKNCTKLKSISIPDTVTTIGQYAFNLCTSLKEAKLPAGITEIPNYIFYECSALERVNVPENVTTIGTHAFLSCKAVKRVDITNINKFAQINYSYVSNSGQNPISYGGGLYLNNELVCNVELDDSVTLIGDCAFAQYTYLQDITWTDKITSIGDYAFYGCSNLKSDIVIPADVSYLGTDAFNRCNNIRKVYYNAVNVENDMGRSNTHPSATFYNIGSACGSAEIIIGESVTVLPKFFLRYNRTVRSLVIPENITTIRENAFNSCVGLVSLTIKSDNITMPETIFSGCSHLVEIIDERATTMVAGDYGTRADVKILKKGDDKVVHRDDDGFFYFEYEENKYDILFYDGVDTDIIIPSSFNGVKITKVGKNIFGNHGSGTCKKINSIVISEGIEELDTQAFYSSKSLTSITLPSSLKTVGSSAFGSCDNLERVDVESINQWMNIDFAGASASPLYNGANLYINNQLLTVLQFNEGITTVKDYLFYGCTSLTKVVIPEGVTSIGVGAFRECTNLVDIQLPSTVISLGDSAFNGCSIITSITLPNSVTSLGNYVFASCSKLTTITIPNSVLTIGNWAFSNCKALTSINFEEGCQLTKFEWQMFNSCTNLKSIIIPPSLTTIGEYCFSGCTGLNAVYISDLAQWCNIFLDSSTRNPFVYAKKLYLNGELVTNLVIPEGVTTIKAYTFYNCTSITSVVLPNSITSLGSYVFNGCTNLQTVTFGSSITDIGQYCFKGCTGLTSIVIPNSVTKIRSYAFQNCTNLTSVTFENPNGWFYATSSSATSGTDLLASDLSNTSTAATYLKTTYYNKYWIRK